VRELISIKSETMFTLDVLIPPPGAEAVFISSIISSAATALAHPTIREGKRTWERFLITGVARIAVTVPKPKNSKVWKVGHVKKLIRTTASMVVRVTAIFSGKSRISRIGISATGSA
jgi:hypothetical protein